ncbi:MAG: hypothetical protein Q9169_008236, partial [Polycauliona sp. 2 TL-2023]
KSFLTHTTSPLKPSITVIPNAAPKPVSHAKAAAIAANNAMGSAIVNQAQEKPRATRTRGAATGKAAKQPAATTKTKTAPITRAKRGVETVAPSKDESRTVSAASNTSTATTVVTKPAKPAVVTKGKTKAVTKKAPAVEAPVQGRRVLRKRG